MSRDFHQAMRDFENILVIGLLKQTGGNVCQAARVSGLHRNTLSRKIRQLTPELRAEIERLRKGASA